MLINVVKLEGSCAVNGAPSLHPRDKDIVRLGTMTSFTDVPVDDKVAFDTSRKRIMRAMPDFISHQEVVGVRPIVSTTDSYSGAIVVNHARDVRLPSHFDPIAEPMSTCWVGLEGGRPIGSHGDPFDVDKRAQAVELKLNQHVYVISSNRTVGKLFWDGRGFSQVIEVTTPELVAYLRDKGLNSRLRKTAVWAERSLRELKFLDEARWVKRRLDNALDLR